MAKVEINYDDKTLCLNVKNGSLLKDILSESEIDFGMPCGGKCLCGKCKIIIDSGQVNGPTFEELTFLSCEDLTKNVRLACNIVVEGNLSISINKKGNAKIVSDFIEKKHKYMPNRNNSQNSFGIAFDIGTTTIVACLCNMENGEIIDRISELNKQSIYGSDVVSRMNFSIENADGAMKLKNLVVGQINGMVKVLCENNHILLNQIMLMTVVGNTIMQHMFLGLDTRTIAFAPFIPEILDKQIISAAKCGIELNCDVILAPSISGYVGGDIVAGVVASDLHNKNDINLLIDIGTNGEMALGNSQKLICCATAAGPAFEGSEITCGVGSVSGAIDAVWVDEGEIGYSTIDNMPAIGICGSGILDLMAVLLHNGQIDATGRMINDFYITNDIKFTPQDVRSIQLAKAAIAAGIDVLLSEYKINFADISNVYISGGLGNNLNKRNAEKIGLIPSQLANKIISIGNSALAGAVEMLLSYKAENSFTEVAKMAKYLELSSNDLFQIKYIENMSFGETEYE